MNTKKLQQTKNQQYWITLPKGLVESIGWQKQDVISVQYERGQIILSKLSAVRTP